MSQRNIPIARAQNDCLGGSVTGQHVSRHQHFIGFLASSSLDVMTEAVCKRYTCDWKCGRSSHPNCTGRTLEEVKRVGDRVETVGKSVVVVSLGIHSSKSSSSNASS